MTLLLVLALLLPCRASAGWQKDEVCQGGCGGGCGPCPGDGGGAAPAAAGGGFTPQQQMGLQMGMVGAQMIGQGLHNALFGDPQAAAAQRAREAALAEQRRQAALEKRREDDATKDRLLGEMMGVDAAADGGAASARPDEASLGLLSDAAAAGKTDPRLSDPRFKSPSFSKGYDDAERCGTQNSGAACADVSGDQAASCFNDYKAGYAAGQKKQAALLERAARKGAGAAMSGLQDNAASDPDSDGDCRTQWVEAYNRGYFQAAHPSRNAR